MWWYYLGWLVVWIIWWLIVCNWLGLPPWSWSVFGALIITGLLANLEKFLFEEYRGNKS